MAPMEEPPTKAEGLELMERGWRELQAALDALSEAQMTGPTDEQGWTGKDHIAHLAAWERSMVYLFSGRPRHLGLGVDEALYLAHDDDAINASIQQRHAAHPLAAARAFHKDVHRQLVAAVEALSDEDVQKPYSHFLPDEPGHDDGSPIAWRIAGNSFGHYEDHLPWLLAIAK